MLMRYSVHQQAPDKVAPGLQDYLATIRPTHTHPSEIEYHNVLDAVADSKDTVMTVISDLYEQYVVQHNLTHLILEGDAKLYKVLLSLKGLSMNMIWNGLCLTLSVTDWLVNCGAVFLLMYLSSHPSVPVLIHLIACLLFR